VTLVGVSREFLQPSFYGVGLDAGVPDVAGEVGVGVIACVTVVVGVGVAVPETAGVGVGVSVGFVLVEPLKDILGL
jgi:hypothetical protein